MSDAADPGRSGLLSFASSVKLLLAAGLWVLQGSVLLGVSLVLLAVACWLSR